MPSLNSPDFRFQRVQSDGTKDPPQIYKVEEIDGDWQMQRRGFMIAAALGTGFMISSCNKRRVESEAKIATTQVKTINGSCEPGVLAHTDYVSALVFSPDGKFLVSGSGDTTIKLWKIPEGTLFRTLWGHKGPVSALAFASDGSYLVSGSYDYTIKLWKMTTCALTKTLKKGESEISSISFNPKDDSFCSGAFNGRITIWKMGAGTISRSLSDRPSKIYGLSFYKDGRLLVVAANKEIEIWDVTTGALVRSLTGHTEHVRAIALSPDGRFVASGSYDETIRIWQMPDGTALKALSAKQGQINSLSFSPDSSLLASGSGNGTVTIWRMPDITPFKILKTAKAYELAFSPEGKLLASGSGDNTIKLWEVAEGNFITCLFDPAALQKGKKMNQYTSRNASGELVTYSLPCGSPIPPGAICTCNCVPGSYNPSPTSGSSGRTGQFCTCDKICTCVPIK